MAALIWRWVVAAVVFARSASRREADKLCETTYPLLPHFYDENFSCSFLLAFALIHAFTLSESLLRIGFDTVIHHHASFIASSDDPKLILPTAAITLLVLCTLFHPADATLLWILWGFTVWLLSSTPEISTCKSNSVMSRTASQPFLPVPSVNPACPFEL